MKCNLVAELFAFRIMRLQRLHTHLMDSEDDEEKVGDAYIPRLT